MQPNAELIQQWLKSIRTDEVIANAMCQMNINVQALVVQNALNGDVMECLYQHARHCLHLVGTTYRMDAAVLAGAAN